jgi:hypothetical protein
VAISQAQFEARVMRLAAQRGVTLDIADVSESLPLALGRLARAVADSPSYAYLHKDFSAVAITSGTADLSAMTDILIDTIERVADNSDPVNVYSRLPNGANRMDLDDPRNEMYYHYVIEGFKLYARNGNGVDFPPNANITVTANFVPVISTVPTVLEDDLIEAGFEVAAERAMAA